MKQNIAISLTDPLRLKEAQNLAAQLQLEFISDPSSDTANTYDFLLLFTTHFLGLQKITENKATPFYIDFLSNKMRYRLTHANLRNELIAKAIGYRPNTHPTIIDVTAGLGRDSLILATLGFNVSMIERSPIVHALLQDALKRCSLPASKQLHLIYANAIDWLKKLSHDEFPDVIYMDPMFPERNKSALAKKEMVMLQLLLGKDEDTEQLFSISLSSIKRRLVVKRPRLAPNICNHAPNFTITGKSNRFDIY